jgi:hypothetical protein
MIDKMQYQLQLISQVSYYFWSISYFNSCR